MIIYLDVSMAIVRVTEPIRGPYNESIYAGDYIKNLSKGYWYELQLPWGVLRRMNEKQAEKLEKLLV